jgi:GTP-binding protein HflX
MAHSQYEDHMNVVLKTLQEMNCSDKPVITVFNKMDLFEKNHFDEWLDPETKATILEEIKNRWQHETQGQCVFVSALERRNMDGLRSTILDKVKELYAIRYPYKTGFYS